MVSCFQSLFGFSESNYPTTPRQSQVSENSNGIMLLTSIPNQQGYQKGKFSTPCILELRIKSKTLKKQKKTNK